ncbi:hypothetical protein K470DRAFT_258283 [Piedraia hortae CBS 480.64]|uniref:Amino acid transporter transmembrane domain-containing protein n=1 Tax=Piedraia hortae CBS 480.64 TaxID=1314780 RepID=A0A6A7BYF2_9PEZI|nr:hypothetical protein K470DRAFT_258283 [Piedraia hortae CBS 480.64]
MADAQSQREAEIVDRHLPEGYSAETVQYPGRETSQDDTDVDEGESSLTLQGGDIHRDIFKIKARANAPKRANTFTASTSVEDGTYVPYSEQQQPGGLRRQFMAQRAFQAQQNIPEFITKNFVNFLEIYGTFAGEDLLDEDDDETASEAGSVSERRPLLPRRPTRRQKLAGDAGTTKTFFTLLKAFIGTGIMFLPKAFRNGGILFSSITLIAVAMITTLCFRLLLSCRKKCGHGGYGELGEAIIGPHLRSLILFSIVLSQLGFVCAGLIFTAENLRSFADAVSHHHSLTVNQLILIQFLILIPLGLIRNISKLGPLALIADAFILIGLIYIWYFDLLTLSRVGLSPSVELFNPSSFPLTIGSSIFTFEGIGLILPIQSSMRRPEKFSSLLSLVMVIITAIFTSVGVLCYATFGEDTKIQIISNFPQNSHLVNSVQFLYSLAILVGEPVQFFPAVRILETSLFGENATGKRSVKIKWWKNGVRVVMLGCCAVVAVIGASDLDKFVALIGSFACVPLVYVYPPWLHLRGVAEREWERMVDYALIGMGVVAMGFTSVVTVVQWVR